MTSLNILILTAISNENDVLHRVQTRALFLGLQGLQISSSLINLRGKPNAKRSGVHQHSVINRLISKFVPGHRSDVLAKSDFQLFSSIDVTPPSHIVFTYNDKIAALSAAEIKSRVKCKVLCFASDIYNITEYVKLSEFVDCFLAPTRLHRDIIQSAIAKRVVLIPESFDPISQSQTEYEGIGERKETNRFCWFGYPESFSKSMKYLIPQAFEMSDINLNRFCILTKENARLLDGVEHRAFEATKFYRDTNDINYSILSHFCYDGHINTFIKSPNKLITSLVRGLIPYASFTPAYCQVAEQYGLEPLLYRSAQELAEKLRTVDFDRDREKFGISAIQADLVKSLSPCSIAEQVLAIM